MAVGFHCATGGPGRGYLFWGQTCVWPSGCFLRLAYSAEMSRDSWVCPSPGARPAAVSREGTWGWHCLPFLLGESIN